MEAREYYRHVQTGDLGYLLDPQTMCLDRVPPVVVDYREGEWKKEPGPEPLIDRQIGRIAFAADRELCRAIGQFAKARRDWNALGEEEQIYFSANGPGAPEIRREVFQAIRTALSGRPVK